MERFLRFDAALSQRFVLPLESHWRRKARVMAHLGDGPYVFGGLGLAGLIGWLRSDFRFCQNILVIAFIVLMTGLIVTLIKFIARRQRPQPPGEFVTFHYDVYSFPSGHSARLAALAVAVLFWDPLWGAILAVIAVGVAGARVVVGVHYLTDIIMGLGVGGLVAWHGVTLLLPLLPVLSP